MGQKVATIVSSEKVILEFFIGQTIQLAFKLHAAASLFRTVGSTPLAY